MDDKKDEVSEEVGEPQVPKMDTAFIQVPAEYKEKVKEFVNELVKDKGKGMEGDADYIDSLPSQGCFLVISLEKIEEIINGLNDCLTMIPDEGAENIKNSIRETLKMLA